jgi:hypothetical protein
MANSAVGIYLILVSVSREISLKTYIPSGLFAVFGAPLPVPQRHNRAGLGIRA